MAALVIASLVAVDARAVDEETALAYANRRARMVEIFVGRRHGSLMQKRAQIYKAHHIEIGTRRLGHYEFTKKLAELEKEPVGQDLVMKYEPEVPRLREPLYSYYELRLLVRKYNRLLRFELGIEKEPDLGPTEERLWLRRAPTDVLLSLDISPTGVALRF